MKSTYQLPFRVIHRDGSTTLVETNRQGRHHIARLHLRTCQNTRYWWSRGSTALMSVVGGHGYEVREVRQHIVKTQLIVATMRARLLHEHLASAG